MRGVYKILRLSIDLMGNDSISSKRTKLTKGKSISLSEDESSTKGKKSKGHRGSVTQIDDMDAMLESNKETDKWQLERVDNRGRRIFTRRLDPSERWIETMDPSSGLPYFFNEHGETRWQLPILRMKKKTNKEEAITRTQMARRRFR